MRSRPQRESRLDLLLHTALDAVVVMSAEGKITEWNERSAEMFGWSRDEAVGRKLATLIIPKRHREAHANGLRRFLETGEEGYLRRRVELPALHRGGGEFPVEVRISPVELADGTAFVGCLRDVSARQALREELQESSRQFQLLVGAITDYAIYMLDPEGRITTWNAGAERIKGYRAEEIIGQHFSRFYSDEDQSAGLPARMLRQAEVEGKVAAEGWRVRKDGSQFAASVVIEAIHDDAGRLIGFAKITRDITAQREAQEMLERAREQLLQAGKMEAIGQLTGGVAHDFNNLLTIIIGNLAIAEREVDVLEGGAATRLRRAINSAERGAQRATTLTQRLLAFSRRQMLDPKPLDLKKLIAGEAISCNTLGEPIESGSQGADCGVRNRRQRIQKARCSISRSMRDAMPDGSKLSQQCLPGQITAAPIQVGQYVMIAVTDNGGGMTKDVMDRAFEPFFSTKSVDAGTGLGLSQVYGFIKQSGGHVKIYSERGEGTNVQIYLPSYTGAPRPDHDEASEGAEAQGRSARRS
jgi:PAS domain S-box-containing protein